MRMTIGARFSVDKALLPLVDSEFDARIAGFVKDDATVFKLPFCPLAKQEISHQKIRIRQRCNGVSEIT